MRGEGHRAARGCLQMPLRARCATQALHRWDILGMFGSSVYLVGGCFTWFAPKVRETLPIFCEAGMVRIARLTGMC